MEATMGKESPGVAGDGCGQAAERWWTCISHPPAGTAAETLQDFASRENVHACTA